MTPALAAVARPIPEHFTAITVSAAAVCLTFVFLLRWKPLHRIEFLTPWLCLVAGIGLGAAFLNGWANTVAGWFRPIPYVGPVLIWVIAIMLAYIVLYDLWPRHASNGLTNVSALLLPAFSPTIGGAAGTALSAGISAVAVAGASILSTAFGL